MSLTKHTISFLASILVCSCAADFTLQYENATMGNFVDGKFISDQGLTFNIVDQTCTVNIDTLERAIISCDILTCTDNGQYDVRLTDFNPIFTKDPVDSTDVTDNDIFKEDPLSINEVWYSGGYLNMHISIPAKGNSSQKHLVNLVRNDINSTTGMHEFTFKHNAFGEVVTDNDSDFIPAGTYISFPLAQMFKEDEQKVQIILKWTSNEERDGILSKETTRNTTSLEIERIGYEHKHLK